MNRLLSSLLNHAHLCPDDVALVDAAGQVTYRELEARVRAKARELDDPPCECLDSPAGGDSDRLVARLAAQLAGAAPRPGVREGAGVFQASQPKTPPVSRP